MSSALPAPAHDRIAGLDGVRGLAMVMVIAAHCVHRDATLGAPTWIDDLWNTAANYCWAGLDIFFVLSGYLITGILLRNRGQRGYFVNFYMRRALRILPLYYLFIVPMLFVFHRPPVTDGLAVAYLTYWHNIWYAWNGMIDWDLARQVTWSLAVEEQFYLVWPAVVLLLSARWLRVACVLLMIGALLLRWWLMASVPAGDVVAEMRAGISVYMLTPCRVDSLAAGSLLAAGLPVRAWMARSVVVAMLAVIVCLVRVQGHGLPVGMLSMTLGCSANVLLACGIIVLAKSGGMVERVLRWRFLQACGSYSYAMFLSHLLLLEVLRPWAWGAPAPGEAAGGFLAHLVHAVGFQLPGIVVFLAMTVVCSLGIGWLSWHLFEKRVLALKRFFPSV